MLNKYRKILNKINCTKVNQLDDDELYFQFRELQNGRIDVVKAFAIIREVFDRRIGIWQIFNTPELLNDNIYKFYQLVQERRTCFGDHQIYLKADFYDIIRSDLKLYEQVKFMPYDVQILGALALYDGKIAEMGTGEGKTIIAVFPACIWALQGKKVHIATVNDYLASRDCKWMGPVYRFLGFSVGCIQSQMTDEERRNSYRADIVYANNYELGFDYLRDNLRYNRADVVQDRLDHVIIDEIDSILMDEGVVPMIISGTNQAQKNSYLSIKPIVEFLIEEQNELIKKFIDEVESGSKIKPIRLIQISQADPYNQWLIDHLSRNKSDAKEMGKIKDKFALARSEYKLESELYYVVDRKERSVKLTDKGIRLLEAKLGQKLVLSDAMDSKSELIRNIIQLLKAYTLFRKDEDYIVQGGRVIIVDEFTGRLAWGKRYEEGLHQAIECKENVKITPENAVVGIITHTNYFRLYKKMVGMTATASTEADEFKRIYGLEVVRIPYNKPVIRIDLPDKVFLTEEEKLKAVVDDIKWHHKFAIPVLVGTRTIEKSELLSELLKAEGIPHKLLNAKNHFYEAEIIKLAGEPYSVTVATNMAGRGTDIKLGRNLYDVVLSKYIEFIRQNIKDGLKIRTYSEQERKMLINRLNQEGISYKLHGEQDIIIGERCSITIDFKAGLYVIGTERHGARRIDHQLTGRAGRQGDPGASRFYLSLHDEIFKHLSNQDISKASELIKHKPTSKALSKLIFEAQRKSEESDYALRKLVIDWDNVLDKQRKHIYRLRWSVLDGHDDLIYELIKGYVNDLVNGTKYPQIGPIDEAKLEELRSLCLKDFGVAITSIDEYADLRTSLINDFTKAWNVHEHLLGKEFSQKMVKSALILTIDEAWTEYLSYRTQLDKSMLLRSHIKDNIMTDYKRESFKAFKDLLSSIRYESLKRIMNYPLPGEKPDSIRKILDRSMLNL